MRDDLATAVESRTQRDAPFGEIVEPFVNGNWDTSYYGSATVSEDHRRSYSAWVINSSHGEKPGKTRLLICHTQIRIDIGRLGLR